MSIRISQNSFSKGILSPSLQGRTDLSQYRLGLKDLKNAIVLQEGCVMNRAGLEYIAKTKYENKKSRLIPFIFNLSQSYILEFGHEYIRIIKDGGYVLNGNNEIYEISSPYQEIDLFNIDYTQQADVITLVHKNYPPYKLSRYNHNDWRLEMIMINPSIEPPSNIQIHYSGSTSSNVTTYNYVVCSVDKYTNEESSKSNVVSVVGHLESYWTTAEKIILNWNSVENAVEYNVYRAVNGIFGYVGTTSTTTFIDNNIEPDLTNCAPKYINPFENENPSCVCYYQQRKVYANSIASPQTIWMSQSGSSNNFNISRPLNANDSINLSLYENTANEIQHIIPFNDLIVITTGSEWVIKGEDGIMSANPTPTARVQSCYGASKIKPVISGSMVLFVQAGGSIVRDLGYNYLSDSYDGEELTILANHLFEGKKIVDMSYSKEPYRILWCIMDDGTINALTYNPAQKIAAWHRHTTQGEFESVTTIKENNEDIAYFIIKREINNETVRYIERFKSRTIKSLKDGFFLDCALAKNFETEVTMVSGLTHLKNTYVTGLIDCGVVENLYVDNEGNCRLPQKAKNVVIGLPYEFKLETLNFEDDSVLGLKKTINKVEVKILNSREDFFIENEDGTLTQNARSRDSINNAEKLYSKIAEFTVLTSPKTNQSIKLVQKFPLPVNILSISTTLSIEEVETR